MASIAIFKWGTNGTMWTMSAVTRMKFDEIPIYSGFTH